MHAKAIVILLVLFSTICSATTTPSPAPSTTTTAPATADATKRGPGLTINPAEKTAIIARINAARRNVAPSAANMLLVAWDYALETAMLKFVAANGPAWFFEKSTFNGPKGGINYNGFGLMQMPEFAAFSGYGFVIHDTTQSKLTDGILKIINFRLNQAHCIKYSNCSATSFSNFESCGNPLVLKPQQPCSWATQYYPKLVLASLATFACVPLDVHGPNAPKIQDMSFWCYGKMTEPQNDVPYVQGASCSQCPPSAPNCVNGLCAAANQ